MLGAFGSAGVGRFDVGALDHGSGKMSLRLDWDRGMLWRAAGWIAGRNATGSSLYIRPARSLEAHPWVLVDGLTGGTLARLREGHPPGLVVETSPGRFQAWVRVAMALPAPGRGAIARALARRYVGDPHGAGGDGLGRLAGTTNRKPGRRRPDGQAPFAPGPAHVEQHGRCKRSKRHERSASAPAGGGRRPPLARAHHPEHAEEVPKRARLRHRVPAD